MSSAVLSFLRGCGEKLVCVLVLMAVSCSPEVVESGRVQVTVVSPDSDRQDLESVETSLAPPEDQAVSVVVPRDFVVVRLDGLVERIDLDSGEQIVSYGNAPEASLPHAFEVSQTISVFSGESHRVLISVCCEPAAGQVYELTPGGVFPEYGPAGVRVAATRTGSLVAYDLGSNQIRVVGRGLDAIVDVYFAGSGDTFVGDREIAMVEAAEATHLVWISSRLDDSPDRADTSLVGTVLVSDSSIGAVKAVEVEEIALLRNRSVVSNGQRVLVAGCSDPNCLTTSVVEIDIESGSAVSIAELPYGSVLGGLGDDGSLLATDHDGNVHHVLVDASKNVMQDTVVATQALSASW